MRNIVEILEDGFNEKIQNGIVVVDFFADWCGPCRALGENLTKLCNDERYGDVTFVKFNAGNEQQTVTEHTSIRSIPTVVVYKGGVEKSRITGNVPITKIAEMIDSAR